MIDCYYYGALRMKPVQLEGISASRLKSYGRVVHDAVTAVVCLRQDVDRPKCLRRRVHYQRPFCSRVNTCFHYTIRFFLPI